MSTLSGSSSNSNGPREIVVLNPGSATIKWARFDSFDATTALEYGHRPLAEIEQQLESLAGSDRVAIYVVRFVHGGDRFSAPVQVDRENYALLQGLEDWAPLHNRHSLRCMEILQQSGNDPAMIAVFDTHFFRDLPLAARSYGLPDHLVRKYRLRRYGFHGFAHQSMRDAWESRMPSGRQYALVTMQLGSGASTAAVRDGDPIDTTMGFSPNEGLLDEHSKWRCGSVPGDLVAAT